MLPKSRGFSVGAAFALALACANLPAATPATGTINDETKSVEWSGGPYVVPNVTLVASDDPVCEEGTPACDVYRFEVALSSADPDNEEITVTVAWPNATGEGDYDIYLYDDATGTRITAAESSAMPEVMVMPAVNGKYKVVIIPYNAVAEGYTGTAAHTTFKTGGKVLDFAGALGGAGLGLLAVLAGLARRWR